MKFCRLVGFSLCNNVIVGQLERFRGCHIPVADAHAREKLRAMSCSHAPVGRPTGSE